jgi:glycosyltransferase involved in cell wall biosynthesis
MQNMLSITPVKTDTPLVSIALPVYNGAETLAAAINSILMQTFEDWELIIVDDGSLDNSVEVAKGFTDQRIRIVYHETNCNLPTSLNEAVGLARGRYLARMDQDDIAFPERLAVQVAYLAERPDIDLVASEVVVFRNDGACRGRFPSFEEHSEICRMPWNGFYLPHPTWVGKIEWFRSNPYNPNAAWAEDQDLLLRSYPVSRFACLPVVLLGYRQSERSFNKMFAARKAFTVSCINNSLQQRQYRTLFFLFFLMPLKVLLDYLRVTTGFKCLKKRLGTVTPGVILRWHKLWYEVHAAPVRDRGF